MNVEETHASAAGTIASLVFTGLNNRRHVKIHIL